MAGIVDRFFTPDDLDRIEQAVGAAEARSDGEIAVVIAPRSRSSLTDPWIWTPVGAIIMMTLALVWSQNRSWTASADSGLVSAIGLASFAILVLLALPLLTRSGRNRAVWKAAMRAFAGLKPTRARTGVLIYVSLAERNAAVIADQAIAEAVPGDYWMKPHEVICKAFTKGAPTEGLIQAIEQIGNELGEHFPRSDDDSDELPNRPTVEP